MVVATSQAISVQEPSELLDEDGLDARYDIPPRTAQRWRSTGEGPRYIRLGARRIVYRVADVEEWLRQRTFASLADEASRAREMRPANHGPLRKSAAAGSAEARFETADIDSSPARRRSPARTTKQPRS